VGFDDGDDAADFDVWESGKICLESCLRCGLEIDPETLRWWSDKAGFFGLLRGRVDLAEAVAGLADFMAGLEPKAGRVWCWGGSFDFPVVGDAFRRCQRPQPWKYWQEHDARSVCGVLGVRRSGATAHGALADASEQSRTVVRALAALKLALCRR